MNTLPALFLTVLLTLPFSSAAQAESTEKIPEKTADGNTKATSTLPGDYKQVDLKELVPTSHMAIAGQRAYFVPAPIKFRARLAALPRPVKTDLLKKSLGLMHVVKPPQVSQAIGIDYGGDKALLAYIEESVAARLGKELKPGDERTFYAYHVYNFDKGPALVVVSYE